MLLPGWYIKLIVLRAQDHPPGAAHGFGDATYPKGDLEVEAGAKRAGFFVRIESGVVSRVAFHLSLVGDEVGQGVLGADAGLDGQDRGGRNKPSDSESRRGIPAGVLVVHF